MFTNGSETNKPVSLRGPHFLQKTLVGEEETEKWIFYNPKAVCGLTQESVTRENEHANCVLAFPFVPFQKKKKRKKTTTNGTREFVKVGATWNSHFCTQMQVLLKTWQTNSKKWEYGFSGDLKTEDVNTACGLSSQLGCWTECAYVGGGEW